MRFRTFTIQVAMVLMAMPLVACTVGGGTRIHPESHFVFPNSNVTPMGPVQVTIQSKPTLFVPPPIRTAELDKELYRMALAQEQGADLIIDYVVTTEVTLLPVPYVSVYLVKHTLEGTAAKMDVGKQRLR